MTETQKTIARVHEIDRALLDGVWNQRDSQDRRAQRAGARSGRARARATCRDCRGLDGGGFAIDFWVKFRELSPGQTILDARDRPGSGIAITSTDRFTLQITLNDGRVIRLGLRSGDARRAR